METAVEVMVPNPLESTFEFGVPHTRWFITLNASNRNCSMWLSLYGM